MKTVADILRSKTKPNNTISSDAKVIDALIMMNSVNLSYLVVMDDNEFKGIFSERDYTRNLILKGRTSDNTQVKDVMTIQIPTISIGDTVETCMRMLDAHKTRYLPVFNGKEFKGVVTLNDVLRQVLANKEDVFDQLAHELFLQDDRIF